MKQKIHELSFSDYVKFIIKHPELLNISPWSPQKIVQESRYWLSKVTNPHPEVLDLGSGFCFHAEEMAKQGAKVTALEQFPEFYIESIKSRNLSDLNNLSLIFQRFPCDLPNRFDLVTIINNFVVFDQVPNIIQELKRILNPNGLVMIQLTCGNPVWKEVETENFSLSDEGQIFHKQSEQLFSIKEYSKSSYNDYLKLNGEKIIKRFNKAGFKTATSKTIIEAQLLAKQKKN